MLNIIHAYTPEAGGRRGVERHGSRGSGPRGRSFVFDGWPQVLAFNRACGLHGWKSYVLYFEE